MKILLAIDGSKPSAGATNLARTLPLAGRAEIVIMHVVFMDPVTKRLLSGPMRSAYRRAASGTNWEQSLFGMHILRP